MRGEEMAVKLRMGSCIEDGETVAFLVSSAKRHLAAIRQQLTPEVENVSFRNEGGGEGEVRLHAPPN
jgi:hypothetical protein